MNCVTVLPGRLGDLVGEAARQRLVVVGDHVDAEARVGNIPSGKPAKMEIEMTRSFFISAARS